MVRYRNTLPVADFLY